MEQFIIIPMDNININKDFIPIKELHLTCKKYYNDYKEYPDQTFKKSYLMKLIRNDYDYIFNIILKKKFNYWFKPWDFKYKQTTFPCFIEFLNFLCLEYKSRRCRKIINDHKKTNGFDKKKYKRIRTKNSRWTN